jgi:raffinose/stachyose/melibiose transport system substrate-binding protein
MIVGAALGSLLLSACISGTGGSSSDGGSEEGGPTVIRYFVGIEETPELEAEAKTIIEDFEAENPDIDVERESISAEDQRTVIQTRLRSPQPPDVFGFDTGPGSWPRRTCSTRWRMPTRSTTGRSTTGPRRA